MFRHPPTAADSPLWVCLKIVNVPALGKRHRRGQLRAYWLYWGVDDFRFRRSRHQRRFEQDHPTVYAATVRLLGEMFRPELLLSPGELVAERRRLAHSRTVHHDHDRRRLEAVIRAAAPACVDDLM